MIDARLTAHVAGILPRPLPGYSPLKRLGLLKCAAL